MNLKEIEAKLQQEMDEFNDRKCQLGVPKDFIETFKKAAMNCNPFNHKINNRVLKGIGKKTEDTLTELEVRLMLPVIRSVPPNILYKNYDDYVVKDGIIEIMMVNANVSVKRIQEKLSERKQTMMKLAGIGVGKPVIQKV